LKLSARSPILATHAVTGASVMNNKPRSDSRDLFRITFLNKGQVYEVYVPEFGGVKRSFIPIQAIIRIDEVEKEGVATISKGDNIAAFPIQFAPRGTNQGQPE